MAYDVIIIGSGPAGLGTAFHLLEQNKNLNVLIIDKAHMCSGGLLNDCKQNYTYPIGFTTEYWERDEAEKLLSKVKEHLNPKILPKANLEKYQKRSDKINLTYSHG